ncbi:hypothetical protein KY951_001342 [Vibrio parahaemolyticus]|nr:hypothetical protein [Vibrio parahaemolyticus]EHU5159172.1 hypothetical protein [Vibrio parahaemolyticus]
MKQQSFTKDFNYLVALIQHLGCHEKWNSRTPRNIADSIGLDMARVSEVLENYPAFFRKSSNLSKQKEPLYSLHIRYARRLRIPDGLVSKTLTGEEMQTLLGLVTDMVRLESEDRRLKEESKQNSIKAWVVIVGALLGALGAIFAAIWSSGVQGAVI